jgi:hypothetical protein
MTQCFCFIFLFTILKWIQNREVVPIRPYVQNASYLFQACFLLGLFFGPEDWSDMFHRNVGWLSTDYMKSYPRRENISKPLLSEPHIQLFRTSEGNILRRLYNTRHNFTIKVFGTKIVRRSITCRNSRPFQATKIIIRYNQNQIFKIIIYHAELSYFKCIIILHIFNHKLFII